VLRYRYKPSHRVFKRISELISIIPGNLGLRVRQHFYKRVLRQCGTNVQFGFGTILNYPDIAVGNDVAFGRYCNLGLADFGDFALVASNCHFVSGPKSHSFNNIDVPICRQPSYRARIAIGRDVWVGTGAIVMASVGDGSVVGAGSIVTKEVASFQVVAGNPAKLVRSRQSTITGMHEKPATELRLASQ
jgi:acetyltransferase-like isoleucine patch superfamily enzyme